MSLLVAFLAALAAAIVVITVAQTWSVYGTLPERVPLGLDASGYPRSMGPRPAIWLLVLVQLGVAAITSFSANALAAHAPGTHGSVLGAAIVAVCVIAILWRVQLLLISCAKSGGSPVPMRAFWMFFAVSMAIVLLDAFAIR